MTVVLVHGNPETDAIWDKLRAELGRSDVVALSPPGFGAPVPDGFCAKSDDYVSWLAAELESITEPVDLVGHDWGGAGCFDPEYVWQRLLRLAGIIDLPAP